jgi:hypothetical protein
MNKKEKPYSKTNSDKYKNLNIIIKKNIIFDYVLNVTYDVPFNEKIDVPKELFCYLLQTKRPDLLKYLFSFKIVVEELISGNNPWLKKRGKLGLYDEKTGVLTLRLSLNKQHSVISFLWLLFHEFRHHIQFNNLNILSCLDNRNREMWLNYYDKNVDTVKHVFHEIDPLEVDANTFACDILDIPYPGSTFAITEKTLKRLK